jgi:tetratricopeptide (TPR) repeat protein
MMYTTQKFTPLLGILLIAVTALLPLSAVAQTGRGIQTFVPSESQMKLEEAMTLLREDGTSITVKAQAEALLREAIAADKKQVRAYYNLAVLLIRNQRESEAKNLLEEAMKDNPKFGDGLALLARIQQSEGRSEASTYFENALSADPMSSVANNYKASEALQNRDWKAAILFSRKSLVGNPESINAYLNMATAYYQTGQLDLAILVCRSGLRLDDKNAPLLNLEGLILLKKDEVKEALASFRKAVESDPTNLEAQLNAGALTMNYNDFTSALTYFDAATQIAPNHQEALLSKGVALRGLEKYEEARVIFQQMIASNPREDKAQYNLCILHHEHLNQYEQALEECTKFGDLIQEGHPKGEEMKRRIDGIKSTIEALKE